MQRGICYGVSVGSGEADLITPQAMNIIKSVDVIFLPGSSRENCASYKILKKAWPEVENREVRFVSFTMSADDEERRRRHEEIVRQTMEILDEGKTVAFPTLGEVSLYSTYFYIHERLEKEGYKSELISGISSVQQVAAKLGVSLAQGEEMLHILPSSKLDDNTLSLAGTKIFMKPGKDLSELISKIKTHSEKTGAFLGGVSNLGMEDEVVAKNADELERLHGYFTIFFVGPSEEEKADATYFENRGCKYYPCHKGEHINCLFCYCPLYSFEDCPGSYKWIEKDGKKIKSCMDCDFPHRKENYAALIKALKN